jgi:hypothetical protein
MTKYGKQLTCEEFQRLMAEDFYDYSHAKKCAICYQLLQELEAIAEAARDMWRYGSDNWPEST